MKRLFISIIILISTISLIAAVETLYFLQTTDVHGNVFPYDYFKDKDSAKGLSKLNSLIKQYREKYSNVILLDCGDMIQGTPLSYLYNHVEKSVPHPVIAAMNYMQYDALTVGNHEVEQGLEVCDRLRSESNFPWLSANSKLEDGSSYYEPYTILERSGIKIGILGLTTPGIPKWLDESVYKGIYWEDMQTSGKEYIEELTGKADLTVGLFHAGFEPEDMINDLLEENASGLVADNVPGFDIVFGGHSHRVSPEDTLFISDENIPLKMISGYHGRYLGVAKIVIEKTDDGVKVLEKKGWIEAIDESTPSDEIDLLLDNYHQATLKFIRKEISSTSSKLSTNDAYYFDNPLIDLINNVQLKNSKADISFASCFNNSLIIDPGPIKIKDIYSIYPYENFLYTIEMSGKNVKDYLEFSARFFQLKDGSIEISKEIAGYNYDISEGISYIIDLTEPTGSRIKDLTLISSGEEIVDSKKYSVAINSFRGSGGGGYLSALGLDSPEITYKSNQEIRNMIIRFLENEPEYKLKSNNNWNIITEKIKQ